MGHASPTSCFIEEMEEPMADLPTDPEIRAKMMVDSSKPLIPGCFLPLHDSQVIWVYFRYESVFRFCKKLWLRWTLPKSCNLSDFQAHRHIRVRVAALESS